MKYDDEFLEELETRVYQEAETIASNAEEENSCEQLMTVVVRSEIFEFYVDVNMFNRHYDETTNSVTYKSSVVCTGVPETNNKRLKKFMYENIYFETLYRD
jgi:hypothetical protein